MKRHAGILPPTHPIKDNPSMWDSALGERAGLCSSIPPYHKDDFTADIGIATDKDKWFKQGGVDLAYDTEHVYKGHRCLKVTATQGVNSNFTRADYVPTSAIDLGSADWTGDNGLFFVAFYVDDKTKFGSLSFYFGSSTLATSYNKAVGAAAYVRNGWNYSTFRKSQFTKTGAADGTAVAKMRITLASASTAGVSVNVSIGQIAFLPDDLAKGIIVFAHDDGYISTNTIAMPALAAHGWAGVSFPIGQGIDAVNQSYMTVAQLHDLKRAGWDIGNHTYSHPSSGQYLSDLSEAEVESTVKRGWDWLVAKGLEPTDLMAYPGGQVSATADHYSEPVMRAVSRHHNYAVVAHNACDVREAQFFSSPLMIPRRYIDDSITLTVAKGYIDAAATDKRILVLCLHDLAHGTNTWDTNYAALADYIASDHTADLEVLTFSQAVKRMAGLSPK